MAKPETLLDRWTNASYQPERGWKDTQHPIAGMAATVEEYTSIAHRAVLGLQDDVETFLRELGLTTAQINHSDFRENYENKSIGFREWFEIKCREYDQDPHADVLIIGPSVKENASSERKIFDEKRSNPDNVRDYLRFIGVVLKTKSSSKARQRHGKSFAILERVLSAIESDPRILAHKNQLFHPHEETGHRSHKSRWIGTDSEDEDIQILAEGKFQHETQMDIDKLTRPFLAIERESLRLQKGFSQASTAKRTNVSKGEAIAKAQFVKQLGIMLYDRVHADAGFNHRFLDPKSPKHGNVPSFWEIDAFIEDHLHLFKPFQQEQFIKRLRASGIFPRSSDFYEAPSASR